MKTTLLSLLISVTIITSFLAFALAKKNEELKTENSELSQEVKRLNVWIVSQEETIANMDEIIRILKFDKESIVSYKELDKYY